MLVAGLNHAAQLAQLVGEDDLLQALAALEGKFADDLQPFGEVDGPERGAVPERAGADDAQSVAEGDAREGCAILEGALADLDHAIRQGQGGQCCAALERALTDDGHAVGHGHVAARAAVAYQHAGLDDKFLFQRKALLERHERRVDLLRAHRLERFHAEVQRCGKLLQGEAQLLRANLGGGGRRCRLGGRLGGRFGGGLGSRFRCGLRRGFRSGRRRRVRFLRLLRGGKLRRRLCGRFRRGFRGGLAIGNSFRRCCDFRDLCAPCGVVGCNCGRAGHQQRRAGDCRKDAQPELFHFHTSNEHNHPS